MIQIGIINPKDVTNVGSVLRAIGCFQADGLLYTGNRYNTAMRYRTDTKNIGEAVPATHVADLLAAKPASSKLVVVELVLGATPLPAFVHPEDALYVFGPEDGSVPQALVDAADEVVYVPTVGCLNLAATVNVLLYDRMTKRGLPQAQSSSHDDLITHSRDTNNRLKVRGS
ncbi:RNA methyltransferase [Thalassolituus sp. LLYu03]|uniref:RNA methyltransferase n=1 Tax=Thalassolituus sp. LLYu03 TaxID=3421656 RepID=UPI003D291667